MIQPPRIRVVSGLDTKGPAAILLEWDERRVLLDAGDGPEEGRLLDVAALPPLDAILVTHNHEDHINALFRFAPSCPVYATPWVARHLPQGLDLRELPYAGPFERFGTTVTTGANGHSPGGVWLHFSLGGGLLYTGDISRESQTIPFASPPMARHVLMDASYGLYDRPLGEARDTLLAMLDEAEQTVLPLPLSGRAADILSAVDSRFPGAWTLEEDLAEDLLRHGELLNLPHLVSLVRKSGVFAPDARILLTSDPHLHEGRGRTVTQDWLKHPKGRQIVFTGHVIAAVQPLLESGLARFCRWNVHPLGPDLHWLAEHCKASHITPLFTPLDRPLWKAALGARFNDKPEFDLS